MRALLTVLAAAALAPAGCSGADGTRSAATREATDTARRVAVPTVTHMAVQEAYRKLRAVGLRVAIPRQFAYRMTSPPLVTAQMPEDGAMVPAGSAVTLTLGRGPTGGPVLTKAKVTVPELIDMTASEATNRLLSLGLRFHIAKVPPLEPSFKPQLLDNYRVVAQTVEPGAVVSGNRRPSVGLYVVPIG
jgi:serine/threonine-protein kinase